MLLVWSCFDTKSTIVNKGVL